MKLKSGDTVSLIAPASQMRSVDLALLHDGISLLESWGLGVRLRIDESHHFYLAGDDNSRSQHLVDALEDPETKAIFCTRGGYGCARLLKCPGVLGANPTPRFIVGHSDITSLHLAASKLWPTLPLVHGPNLATRQLLGEGPACEANRQSLRQSLFAPGRTVQAVDFIRPGTAQGILAGGCLTLVASSMGTAFAPDCRGRILFLEDTGEAPFKIDRMLTHLRSAGLFDGVSGVVFGVMKGCTDPYNDLSEVIADVLSGLDFPVAIGLASGHGEVNTSLRLGSVAHLDSETSQFILDYEDQ